ncbi:MAG: response regulator, partial [Magnetococcales bacterium]|nr:response regulator [Magnetococcales bacterium]
MHQPAPLLRLITITTGFIAALVLLLPPLIHLWLSWDHANKQLTTELRIHTLSINKFISNNPVVWPSQGIRLKAVLEDAHAPGTSVRVFSLHDGQEVGQMLESLPWPRLARREALYDYGEPVGEVEIFLSWYGELLPVLFTLLCSVIGGLAVFFPLRRLTLRVVRQATLALQEAKELAEESSRVKSEFLANMSHEIRTPMNAVIGLAALALQQQMPPRVRDYLQKIDNASHTLLRVINDILDFSKLEAGRITLECADFDLDHLYEKLADLFRDQMEGKKLELVMGMEPACPTALRGDALRLEQVLINLIGNAIKFTEQGSVRIWVIEELEPADAVGAFDACAGEERVCLRFSVQDSGIGMTAAQMAGLFRPFSQADGSTTRLYGGTGLGLSISRHLVERMGGRIWVESEPGRGALFQFTAALVRRPPSARHALMPTSVPVAALPRVAGARVLLVEDNSINQQVAREMLEQVGLLVTVANHGLEATRLVLEASFDLVFMDIQMPVMDGYAATRQIRSTPRCAHWPIIAMTAHAMEGDRQKSLDAGMNDHISKPIDRSQLYALLSRWIAPREQPAPPSGPLPDQGGAVGRDDWELLRHLPGVDVAAGVGRLGGDRRLFRRLLLEFERDFAASAEEIRRALTGRRRDDLQRAQTVAHALKGVAANLSAVGVQQAAAALEKAIAGDQPARWPVLLEALEAALRPLMESIRLLAESGEQESSVPPPAADPLRTQELLNQLAILILQGSSQAGRCCAELKCVLQEDALAQDMAQLEAALDRFDFQEARTALT